MPATPDNRAADVSQAPAARPVDQLLIDHLPPLDPVQVLCTTQGWGQLAAAAGAAYRRACVECLLLDAHRALRAVETLAGAARNVSYVCQSDFSPVEADLALLPLPAGGEAELARDLLQQAHQRLRVGGALLAATDNPRDTWLRGVLDGLFGRASRRATDAGAVYQAVKSAPLKKLKNYDCWFPLRDGERTLTVLSRPGVFCHRRVDPGARALLAALDVRPGERVWEIGCGSGTLSLAAAARGAAWVSAVDANPRAVECLRRGAEANGLTNVRAALNADGACDAPGTYHLVLANPPYYSNFRIAEIFLRGALAALAPGGRLQLVTKQPEWFVEQLTPAARSVRVAEVKGYAIVAATVR